MPRGKRVDYVGAWHHIMNRGIARRTVFEDHECVRHFLAQLARAVRTGDFEVHAFVIMTTHFHLLVRSPTGNLSAVMQRLQNTYVRWFNRRARRDGPLFRGRYLSRVVECLDYRRVLVRYIDQNPVVARMVDNPQDYPHGSARLYTGSDGPRWLAREWVEQDVRTRTNSTAFSGTAYAGVFGDGLSAGQREFVTARIQHPTCESDPLKNLVEAAPKSVARWMQRKAALADGTRPGLACVPVDSGLAALERAETERPAWSLARDKGTTEVWPVMRIAVLRDLAGLGWKRIAAVTSSSEAACQRRYACHQRWIETEATYERELGRVCHASLRGWC